MNDDATKPTIGKIYQRILDGEDNFATPVAIELRRSDVIFAINEMWFKDFRGGIDIKLPDEPITITLRKVVDE